MPRKHDRACSASNQDTDVPKPKRQKLTDSQLERKRELDREAQRTIRERTKTHIAHLEGLVKQLQGEPGSEVQRLVAQLNESRTEINRLRDALGSIVKTANLVGDASTSTGDRIKEEFSPNSTDNSIGPISVQPSKQEICEPYHSSVAINNTFSPATGFYPSPHPPHRLCTMFPTIDQLLAANLRTAEHTEVISTEDESAPAPVAPESDSNSHLSIAQMASSIVGKNKLEGKLWYLAGTLLSHILQTQESCTFVSFRHDEDIAIRAIFEGWSSVMERYPLDRGWQWLKELDERIYFRHLGSAERLMHLRNSRLQFLHQLYPDAGWNHQLPAFFEPRPSQQFLQHDPLVEHFPWPAFRERLLFSPRQFATNKFMEALRRNVHFIWNYDYNDMFHKDATSGLYLYSDRYVKHIMDLRCYSVKSPFFDNFPELKNDIPHNNPSPFSMIRSPEMKKLELLRKHSLRELSVTGSVDGFRGDRKVEECFDSGYEDTTTDAWQFAFGSPTLSNFGESLASAA